MALMTDQQVTLKMNQIMMDTFGTRDTKHPLPPKGYWEIMRAMKKAYEAGRQDAKSPMIYMP